jgi:hypothetical protein
MNKEPEGLAFLQKIAELACSDRGIKHAWLRKDGNYLLTVECEEKTLTFQLESATLDDPGSSEYREIAEKILERILEDSRSDQKANLASLARAFDAGKAPRRDN